MDANQDFSINQEQAQQIIDRHLTDKQYTIVKLVELRNHGYSHTHDMKTFIADFAESAHSPADLACFLTIARPTPTTSGPYPTHPLTVVNNLLTLIRTQTAIPILESTLDTSLSLVPFHYLLAPPSPTPSSSILSLAAARSSGSFPDHSQVYIDLLIGTLLAQLHTGVQNDWYGFPTTLAEDKHPKNPSRLSWQETFTELFETLLHEVESDEPAYGVTLPYSDIRTYLSRAIGSFLFDDVEVPSLVWFTGFEEDIYITLPSPKEEHGAVVAILPNVAQALWGDPLLETFMMGSPLSLDAIAQGQGPSEAFMQGYVSGGGKHVLSFTRQKTKRIWYSVFLALFVLTKYGKLTDDKTEEWVTQKIEWARQTLVACVSALKDAPCS